jgi:O-antigen ligase
MMMIAQCYRWLLAAAAAYLALLPTNAATFGRSVFFGVSSILALSLIAAGLTGRGERVPSPGVAILATLGAWCAWDFASIAWSVHAGYTGGELRREIAWGLLVMAAFYVAARDTRAWQTLVGAALASFALLAALAVGLATSIGGWDAGHWHAGVGAFSTYLVLVAPLLLTLLAPAPAGFGDRRSSTMLAVVLLALLLATARLSDNRMVWVALAVVFATGSALAAFRWRAALGRAPMRWLAPLLALLLVLGVLFTETALDKARAHFPPQTTLAQAFADDPRLQLWDRTVELISERPWTGYGFGKSILQQELRSELHDPMLSHAHNLFVSQWLQTGAIGFATFIALLGALLWRYIRFFRASDDTIALLGVIGIALLAGFVVKNLTDDFLLRSNSKEFWAINAALLGFGVRRERACGIAAVRGQTTFS